MWYDSAPKVIFAGPHKFDPYTLVEARLITCRMMSSETYLIFFLNEKIGNFIQMNGFGIFFHPNYTRIDSMSLEFSFNQIIQESSFLIHAGLLPKF